MTFLTRLTEVRMSWSGTILVIAGALLLANNFGPIQWGWLQQWWPVLLIALGIWSILRPARGERHRRGAASSEVMATRDGDRRP